MKLIGIPTDGSAKEPTVKFNANSATAKDGLKRETDMDLDVAVCPPGYIGECNFVNNDNYRGRYKLSNTDLFDDFVATDREIALIEAYRKHPEMQSAVKTLLGVADEDLLKY